MAWWRVRDSTVIDDCLTAFKNKDYDEAVRLLPLAADKAKKNRPVYDFSSCPLSKYTISISSIDPWYNGELKADLFHLSSRNGWLDITKKLIEQYKFDPRERENGGNTCLHYAAAGNQPEVMKHLTNTGQLIGELHSVRNKYGATPLHIAAANGSLDVIKYIIEHYHSVWNTKHTDSKDRKVLHYGAKHIDIVKYLITECNCDPMATDKDGKTVLHYAVEHINNVKYLITECNCDPMVTDTDGKTVLHYAVEQNSLNVVEYLVLTGKCDPILAANKYGNTVLLFASGLLHIVKNLIDNHQCDPTVTDKDGKTVLHYGAKHIDIVEYLITECKCDPMVTDKDGKTVLHYAVEHNCLDAVEYLLLTNKCNPVAKDNKKRTPLQLTNDYNRQKVRPLFKKFGQVKTSHPVDSYVNVLLLGNPGAGKSTLSKVINETNTGSIAFGAFRNVGEVEPYTAGIIPYKLLHKKLGNIILHDFAGHSEYYSSHSAVIENLLQGSAGVFLILVNILEKGAIKQLHQWLTVVRNEAQKALDQQCHVIVVVSHVDEISDPVERRKRKKVIRSIVGRERSVFLDCRKLGGKCVDLLFNKLFSACESIRSTSGRNLILYCHMMYGLLEERKENILTLSDVMTAAKDNDSYVLPDEREEVLDVLHSLDSIGLIKVLKSEDKVWVVVNKGILLTELDGILFAPKTFNEHVDIASNTGIVSVSDLTRLFPDYDPDMLICFLKNMKLCQEMSSLRMTNLIPLREMERRGKRLLFFPCLLHSDRPDEMTSQVYQFGWCLQCTGKHHFFPPRYFHVLSLHFAYKLALPQDEILNRCCTFWKNGLYWSKGDGVGVLVEIVDESQCVLVLMSCKEGYNMVELRREVIGEVMSVYKKSCPSLEVKELVIDPKELDYPVNTPRERTVYSVKAILTVIKEKRPFAVLGTGIEGREVKSILPDESLVDINNISLLGGRDIKV